jgi:hypothetical protein
LLRPARTGTKRVPISKGILVMHLYQCQSLVETPTTHVKEPSVNTITLQNERENNKHRVIGPFKRA